MRLKEIYEKQTEKEGIFFNTKMPVISFEIYPPKNDTDKTKENKLFCELKRLKTFNPSLISVTYGAGGSNQNQSIEIIKRIKEELDTTPMPHFTCVSTSKENITKYLTEIESEGIKNILALRGDIPENKSICHDFQHASDLIDYIKKETTLSVAAAGYPETHKEATSEKDDIRYLKEKIEKGAEVVYTQLFFNNDYFFSFVDKCEKENINVPIIPGILPIKSLEQVQKMSEMCKVCIPKEILEKIEKHRDNKEYITEFGIDYAIYQCQQLIDSGVKGLHFYTMNRAYEVSEILSNLN